jgi:hypothetical protein
MLFGDFMTKHNPTAAIPIVFQVCQGLGSLLQLPTLYVIKYFNLGDLVALSEGYLTQAQGNNWLLYTRAASYLGSPNILFESTVISANRGNTLSGRGSSWSPPRTAASAFSPATKSSPPSHRPSPISPAGT